MIQLDPPIPGSVVTFGMWDLFQGRARFIGIGVVDGPPERHPMLDRDRLPIRPLRPDDRAPAWISPADIIDSVPPSI